MENVAELVKKFRLYSDSGQSHPKDKWLGLVIIEKYWKRIFENSFEITLLRKYFDSISHDEREDYLQFGIDSFVCFVQANFTGPALPKPVSEFLSKERYQRPNFMKEVCTYNNEIDPNVKHPVLLLASKLIFDGCVVNEIVNSWWCCRAVLVHQHILELLSPTLLSHANCVYKKLQDAPLEGRMKAELDIELAQLFLRFRFVTKAEERTTSAYNILGLEHKLIGVLGKRTKFQEKELAQLTLQVTLKDKENITRPEVTSTDVPKNVELNDDTLLNKVELTQNIKSDQLPNTEQKLLLAIVQKTLIASSKDELQEEEMSAFIDLILSQKNSFCVRVAALLLRCRLEGHHKRTIERCIKQCADLLSSFKKESPHPVERIEDAFGTSVPPIWYSDAQYADMLLNSGRIKESLDVFLRIKSWAEVIGCYTILNKKKKATEVIKEQLKVKPTEKLFCLLGDATDDVACYERAWMMSQKRSHQAQRHWGQYYFQRKKYEECIPHFEKSLSIYPHQPHIWLRLGYAALESGQWQTAATAYRRYTALEPMGFEPWNNLAQAYIRLENKGGAHHALSEALKYNYEDWKVWENFLVMSCETHHYSDVVHAYNQILNLKQKYLNLQVLKALANRKAIPKNGVIRKHNSEDIQEKFEELLRRLTTIYPNCGEIWEMYGDVATSMLVRANRLQEAYKAYYMQSGWETDPKKCMMLLQVVNKLGNTCLDDEIDAQDPIIKTSGANLMSVLTFARKQTWEETKSLVLTVAYQAKQMIEKIVSADNGKAPLEEDPVN